MPIHTRKPKHYLVETNRAGRSTSQMCRGFARRAYRTLRIPHQPTALIVIDPNRRPWGVTRAEIARVAGGPMASVIVMSGQTRHVFQLDRRGNQPGRWLRRW